MKITKNDISGYAKGKEVTHIIINDIYTLCTANQKNKKEMLPEDNLKSINCVTCKKCQRSSLYKNLTFQDLYDKTIEKSLSNNKNNKKQNNIETKNKKQKSSNNKQVKVWIKHKNSKYSVLTGNIKKNEIKLEDGEKLELLGSVKTIEDFNKITENGEIIGKITKERFIEKIKEYKNKKQNKESIILKKENDKLKDNINKLSKEIVSIKDDFEVLSNNYEALLREKNNIENKYNKLLEENNLNNSNYTEKLILITKLVENIKGEFSAKPKTNSSFKIIHGHSCQSFFDNVPKEIVINALLILNNHSFVSSFWNGRHSVPRELITQSRKAMELAYLLSNKNYPEDLKKIAEEYNAKQTKIKRIKKNQIIIKRRIPQKIFIKRR